MVTHIIGSVCLFVNSLNIQRFLFRCGNFWFFSVIIYMSIRIGKYCLLVIIVLEFPIEISDGSESSDAVNDEHDDDDDDEEGHVDTTQSLTTEDIIDILIRLLLELKRRLSDN